MAFTALIVGVGQTVFDEIESEYCNFGLKIIYGVEVILLFNISTVVCYKTLNICHDIYNFLTKGRLPSQAFKRRRKYVMLIIWTGSGIYMIFYVTMASWTAFSPIEGQLETFDTLNWSALWIEGILFATDAILCWVSDRFMSKI